MVELFREEAVQHRRRRLYGDVIVRHSSILNYSAVAIALVAAALLTGAVIASYARTEILRGILVTSLPLSKVYALRNGVVRAVLVKDGDVVEAGDTLAVIGVDARSGNGSAVGELTVASLERQADWVLRQTRLVELVLDQETKRLETAIERNREERASIQAQLELQSEIRRSAEQLSEVIKPLVASGAVSRLEQEKRAQALLQEKQRIYQLEQQKTQNDAQFQQYHAQIGKAKSDADRQLSELKGNLESIEQQRTKIRADIDYAIVSPVRGRISALRATVGRTVDTRAPLLTIVPESSSFQAELYAPSSSIGFLAADQSVRLMYDAYPVRRFGSFGGKIVRVSRSVLNPTELDIPLKTEEPVYTVIVALDEQTAQVSGLNLPLQAGMMLQASVILERRSFAGWLLEPIRAVRHRQ
jgi:membrane fusion protein